MLDLDSTQHAALRTRFHPERPGPLVGPHLLQTGYGSCRADRWPDPRVLLVGVGGNYALVGDPAALSPDDLTDLVGLVDAPPEFERPLREACREFGIWDRVILALHGPPRYESPPGVDLRLLHEGDSDALRGLSSRVDWIAETLGGPEGLAKSGLGFGAFVDDTLASVATPFMIGESFEDMAVVTEAAFRGNGLSPACAGRVAEAIRARGRVPSWSTSPDNLPSLRVAEKLGFAEERRSHLYVVGQPIPGVATPPGA